MREYIMAEACGTAVLHSINPGGAAAEFKFSLPSVVAVVPRVVDALLGRITSLRVRDGSEDDIELALQEALLNAVIHGNRQDPFKRVYITLRCEADGVVEITIRDEGAGFDVACVADPTAPEHLLCKHGRGIFLMRAMMDEVSFEDGGTVVHMRKGPNVIPRSDHMGFRASA
jgi:serine/threonine-protein kinase RsbW